MKSEIKSKFTDNSLLSPRVKLVVMLISVAVTIGALSVSAIVGTDVYIKWSKYREQSTEMENLNNRELQVDTNIKKFFSEKGINAVISSKDIHNEIEKLATKADSSCEIKNTRDVDSSSIHITQTEVNLDDITINKVVNFIQDAEKISDGITIADATIDRSDDLSLHLKCVISAIAKK